MCDRHAECAKGWGGGGCGAGCVAILLEASPAHVVAMSGARLHVVCGGPADSSEKAQPKKRPQPAAGSPKAKAKKAISVSSTSKSPPKRKAKRARSSQRPKSMSSSRPPRTRRRPLPLPKGKGKKAPSPSRSPSPNRESKGRQEKAVETIDEIQNRCRVSPWRFRRPERQQVKGRWLPKGGKGASKGGSEPNAVGAEAKEDEWRRLRPEFRQAPRQGVSRSGRGGHREYDSWYDFYEAVCEAIGCGEGPKQPWDWESHRQRRKLRRQNATEWGPENAN